MRRRERSHMIHITDHGTGCHVQVKCNEDGAFSMINLSIHSSG